MAAEVFETLSRVVAARATPDGAAWFEAKRAGGRAALTSAFSAAGRKLGLSPVADGVPSVLANRGLDEVGRVALLLAAVHASPDGHEALLSDLFDKGEAREKQSVLRALPLLPQPARFLAIGVEACRSSVATVFEAIACENPYPAEHFPDPAYNQMVLKAIFNEVPVARIEGLAARATPELARMGEGYRDERRAAGRKIPADLDVIRDLARRER